MPGGPKNISDMVAHTADLPVMPGPVLRLMHLAGEPTSSASQLADAISAEPSLAARVLRLANSAYYGMPSKVTTIQGAVVLLGISTVRNLAMLAAAHSWFCDQSEKVAAAAKQMWDHALGVAAAASTVARHVAPEIESEAFCAGLLHDIGKNVLAVWFGERMSEVAARAEQEGLPVHLVEKAVFGFDHTEAGYALGLRWKLPERLVTVIRYHHDPNALAEPGKLLDIVHVADYLYSRSRHGSNAPAPCRESCARLRLVNEATFEHLAEAMKAQQEQAQRIMLEAA